MANKIKILFILPSLRPGGAERVVSFIAQHLDKTKFEPKLLIVGYEKKAVYSIENIETVFLNKSRVLFGIIGIFNNIKTFKPDIVMTSIAHLTMVTVLQSYFFRRTKFVSREANIKKISRQYHNEMPSVIGKILSNRSYKLLDLIICQSKDMANELIELHPIVAHKITIINNPITKVYASEITTATPTKTNYITVGRLHEEKGHCRILEALSLLDYDFNYTIIGKGTYKDTIVEKAKELDLMDKIIWVDFTDVVQKHLIESSVFIQGSFAEGFPNALLESCTVGTPVIAYKCLGGTSEIIATGINGFLVDSEIELKEKLVNLKLYPMDRRQIITSVMKKFSPEQIIEHYEKTFTNLVRN
ncbi:glycosyltransferase [Psychroserpens burtonensis]|uniref:Glycosyltransferase n=1 Tax=Psychroserpens burtonensis TaxID=49278 RepID=A0A5C7BB16_9FLAO|nr:glycosyltransferase [Psychroserpens burtonensis]TXE20243.1 glycosyltransferase [Psychroserpens burtonensis]